MADDSLNWRKTHAFKVDIYAFVLGILPAILVVVLAMVAYMAFVPPSERHAVVDIIGSSLLLMVGTFWFGYLLLSNGPPIPQPKSNFFCAKCGLHIPSTIAWECGFCHAEHLQPRGRWTFLGRCKKCRQIPPDYECHHCSALLPLIEPAPASTATQSVGVPQHRHPARQAFDSEPGISHEQARARRQREREITEDTTLLTKAQAQLLEAELGRLLQERKVQALKDDVAGKTIDRVARMGQQLESAVGSILTDITTRKGLRETILAKRAQLEKSADFVVLTAAEQRRVREQFDTIADQLERALRKSK